MGGGLSATAHAQPTRVWPVVWSYLGVMTLEESKGFAFNPSFSRMILFGNVRLLSTPAMAVAVGNILRGMIGVHRNLSFLMPNPATC